jgi:ketosteroid isomerase-like protein
VSQENVDLLRARFESFARTGTDPDWYHPDVLWHLRQDLPESETLVGRDRVLRLFSEWETAFEPFRVDVDELIDAGDVVIAVLWLRGVIKASSQEIEMSETWVIRIVNGVNVETWEYKTKAEALEAVGLGE